ncbi:MFS transporter [Albimonas sp. CAU 1670]|uniref:MFS transporter n=1 Tax=Albimonas sp. CAU 1670 TaxID=3032599 RepID=UPI0023DB4B53|nr:MFS transporter [Albimonas sp. CAU 1670]MDF2232793.1 MFS transporter [Albimonas sp. CAU 1670]
MLALALGGFAIGVAEFASMSLVPFFSADFGIRETQAGHAISAYALGVCVGAPVITVLAARIARRRILVGLMAVFALANGLSGLVEGYGAFVASRFAAGLPHGAYLGAAALMAASLVPPGRRGTAVARVLLGLTVATIVGVPLANALGQGFGWRWAYGMVAAIAAASAAMIALFAPLQAPDALASPLRELGALRRRQVWWTLGMGAIGFAGMFCVYTYLGSILIEHAGAPASRLPAMLAVFGLGMTLGSMAGGWAADRAMTPAILASLGLSVVSMLFFSTVADDAAWMVPAVFLVGWGCALSPILQTRLMNVAGDAQMLAAALNHSAFNAANALGPWLGGLALAAGWGWASVGVVGAGLAAGGMVFVALAALDDASRRRWQGRVV